MITVIPRRAALIAIEGHELVIVGAEFSAATERIVNHLASTHKVRINAVFFRVFKDGDREYIARVWLRDPTAIDSTEAADANEATESPPSTNIAIDSRNGLAEEFDEFSTGVGPQVWPAFRIAVAAANTFCADGVGISCLP